MIRWSGRHPLILAVPDQQTCLQLNAIPTIGFSDPILSYFSALRYNFDGIRMVREGYEKVICVPLEYVDVLLRVKLTTTLLLDKTRFIQNCQFS